MNQSTNRDVDSASDIHSSTVKKSSYWTPVRRAAARLIVLAFICASGGFASLMLGGIPLSTGLGLAILFFTGFFYFFNKGYELIYGEEGVSGG